MRTGVGEMQIKIPRRAVQIWDAAGDFLNVPIAGPVRRLDILLGVGLAAAIVYGYWSGGWWYALLNGLMFVLGGMVGLWFF